MEFPARYAPEKRLGEGAGGEVWSATDRLTGRNVAIKLLRDGADEAEVAALVREAVALSGIEGLGAPAVIHFGTLPAAGRAYMVRDMVPGDSLAAGLASGIPCSKALAALVDAADQVSRLHGALLLHGDLKPANIILTPKGRAVLVDLGLAAHWHEEGGKTEGLTPKFAAPELFTGGALTPFAEVHALGASGRELLERGKDDLTAVVRTAVLGVLDRATAKVASARHPSADEFAEALRGALGLLRHERTSALHDWPITAMEQRGTELLLRVKALPAGGALILAGAPGSGKSHLLRWAGWSLGVQGLSVMLVESGQDPQLAIKLATTGREASSVVLMIDDIDQQSAPAIQALTTFRNDGGRVVLVAPEGEGLELDGSTCGLYQIPPLPRKLLTELARRAIPSLSEALAERVVERADGRPGVLRALLSRLDGSAVVVEADIERLLSVDSDDPLPTRQLHRLLDQGRFDEVADALRNARGDGLLIGIARARLATGTGRPADAVAELESCRTEVEKRQKWRSLWSLHAARAQLRLGKYAQSVAEAQKAMEWVNEAGHNAAEAEAERAQIMAVLGLAQGLSGDRAGGITSLRKAVEHATVSDQHRARAVALGSLAYALQRSGDLVGAEKNYAQALAAAERAGDAGTVATTRLNLATNARLRGALALALDHLEAAVDMGRRSGRLTTVRQALLNLANLEIYLGRLARARGSLDSLASQRESLSAAERAQLLGLEADAAAQADNFELAQAKCDECAEAYTEMGRTTDASEAVMESITFALMDGNGDVKALRARVAEARELSGDSEVHRISLLTVEAQVLALGGDGEQALAMITEAIGLARSTQQSERLWRALDTRAELRAYLGTPDAAGEDLAEAIGVLEAIATTLPRDLREVFWSEPRRKRVRRRGSSDLGDEATVFSEIVSAPNSTELRRDRLHRLLEINREIAGEYDLDRLLERVTDHALALSRAERGFVLLRSRHGEDQLSVHAFRHTEGQDSHARFSKSIAEKVVQTGEAFVAMDAGADPRVKDYVSVHALMVKSVACVPIRARGGSPIGALYVETRLHPSANFDAELMLLGALADQAAIAIETARLVGENRRRADELEEANRELETAHAKVERVLGRRTEQLQTTRQRLQKAQKVLRGHFGYQGIVGTSDPMRRMYAIIERLKDTDVAVLITGESGTGKEVVARAIHNAGGRAKNRFVGVNCGAIPQHLLESELFGHVRGAFTGADRDKKGLFRDLTDGTILLDEIGEMPEKMQAGLLRVLQEKVVRPVGGTHEEKVNTRVVAATHRDLTAMVANGEFREDLFYRLNVIEVRVPALRDRTEDIPPLIDHFLRLFATRYNRDRRSVTREAIARLMAYKWPGNVRQLENTLLNAWILADGDVLDVDDFNLPERVLAPPSRERSHAVAAANPNPTTPQAAAADEKERILTALNDCSWNRAKAAELVGMPRRTFYRRLKKYGIQ